MPFPKLQPMPLAIASGSTDVFVTSFDENTKLEVVSSKDFHEELPPAYMFDLNYLIKNKIPLAYTKTQLLNGNTLTIRETPKANEETSTTDENQENN